jgi:mono/diheme cytochrome c family protein
VGRQRRHAVRRLAALAAVALAAVPAGLAAAGGGAMGDPARGAAVFLRAGCGGCHTVAAVKTAGEVGPPLDGLWVPAATAVTVVTHGSLHMPAFGGRLGARQIEDVAAFVAAVGRSEPVELLPDLDPGAPQGVAASRRHLGGRLRPVLRFAVAIENTGPGPLELRQAGEPAGGELPAAQVVTASDGSSRLLPDPARLVLGGSRDWETASVAAAELRRAGSGRILRRASVSLCLADGAPAQDMPPTAPAEAVYGPGCGRGDAAPTGLEVGVSSGWRARAAAAELELSGLRAGRYVLTLRTDAERALLQARVAPAAASALVELSWPRGRDAAPLVRTLRRCPDRARC